jgi:DNA-binding protein YbaB
MDADALRTYVEELRTNFLRLQNESQAFHDRARAVQVVERSPDGLVTVTVGARGDLIRIELDPRALRRTDSQTLADLITETAHRAAAKAQDQVVEIFEPLIPAAQMRAQLEGDLDTGLWQLTEQMKGNEVT